MEIKKLSQEPFVWINSAVLIYSAGLFFTFVLYDYFLEHYADATVKILTDIQVILTMLFSVIGGIGLLKVKRK